MYKKIWWFFIFICTLFFSIDIFANDFLALIPQIEQSEFIRNEPTTPFFYFHSGIYFGIIITILIVNFFFYLNLKDSIYLYYILLVFSTNFVLAYHEGLLKTYIQNTFFKYDVDMVSHYIQLIAGFLFFRKFVKLKVHLSRIDIILKIILLVVTITYLGYFLNYEYQWLAFADILGISFFFLIWIISFFLFKKEPSAKLLTVGFGVIIISGFFHIILSGVPNIPVFGHSTNIVKVGAILEAIILTYATTYRTKILKEENTRINFELQRYIGQVLNLENSLNVLNENNNKQNKERIDSKIISLSNEHNLTIREKEVFILIIKSLNNQQIAGKLFISINTVKYHTRNIYEKLDVKKRGDLIEKTLLKIE